MPTNDDNHDMSTNDDKPITTPEGHGLVPCDRRGNELHTGMRCECGATGALSLQMYVEHIKKVTTHEVTLRGDLWMCSCGSQGQRGVSTIKHLQERAPGRNIVMRLENADG